MLEEYLGNALNFLSWRRRVPLMTLDDQYLACTFKAFLYLHVGIKVQSFQFVSFIKPIFYYRIRFLLLRWILRHLLQLTFFRWIWSLFGINIWHPEASFIPNHQWKLAKLWTGNYAQASDIYYKKGKKALEIIWKRWFFQAR